MSSTAPVPELVDALARDGIVAVPGAFGPDWADRLREDFEAAFAAAGSIAGGLVDRGPQRWYFAVHPEQLRGFTGLITAPVVRALCETVLGDDYEFVELGFDVPLPGATGQPWHRDFPHPGGERLTSLAFNLTAVDVDPDMGPLEIAPGTHRDPGDDFEAGMFPASRHWTRYERLATRRCPRRGDLSARSGLTVHRGTANTSATARPVLILGATTPATVTDVHQLPVTAAYYAGLPPEVRRHLRCTVVTEPGPLVQRHRIEGLAGG